jgi:hypothetical protein
MVGTPFELYLANLRGLFWEGAMYYMPPDVALQKLKDLTKQDFGYDDKKWEEWGRENDWFVKWE